MTRERITIGAEAGWCFFGQADLQVVQHCHRGGRAGLHFSRKRLIDGRWEIDRWFVWGRWVGTRFVAQGDES